MGQAAVSAAYHESEGFHQQEDAGSREVTQQSQQGNPLQVPEEFDFLDAHLAAALKKGYGFVIG